MRTPAPSTPLGRDMGPQASNTELSPEPEACATGTLLRRNPVRGSVATRLLPSEPQPRAAWAWLLPVSGRSPAEARAHTRLFLSRCRAIPDDFSDMAVLVVSELVTNAYTAMDTGPIAGICCIDLSLRLFDGHLLIEVIDSSPKPPVPNLDENDSATGGRGLAVVDNFSGHQWGYFWRRDRKVVFCVLPLTLDSTPKLQPEDAACATERGSEP